MADSWYDIWEEAEDAIAIILSDSLEGTPHVDELPDILPAEETCMYVLELDGGGEAIEPDSENYETKGDEDGGAVEKQINASIMAIACTSGRVALTGDGSKTLGVV